MRILKAKRILETIALALCVAMLLTAGAQVIAREQSKPEITDEQITVEEKNNTIIEAEQKEEKKVKAIAEEQTEMEVAITNKEYDLLARAVYSEARGEPFQGQVAIAAVILNRVEHENFPDSISDVIFQPSAFTAVQDGQFWLTPDSSAYEAVEKALAGNDPSGGATFYYNPVTATSQWIYSRPIITAIGKHVFAV
jgi:N-acetylmuramoyl-L-alanine amidase